jgi:hypothetical protein
LPHSANPCYDLGDRRSSGVPVALLRDWFNGRTTASQAVDTGSIPVSRLIIPPLLVELPPEGLLQTVQGLAPGEGFETISERDLVSRSGPGNTELFNLEIIGLRLRGGTPHDLGIGDQVLLAAFPH